MVSTVSDVLVIYSAVLCTMTYQSLHPIDQSHKAHNGLGKYVIRHHFVTEMCTHRTFLLTEWCIIGYGAGVLWICENCWIAPGIKIVYAMVYTEVVGITILYSSSETGHHIHHLKAWKRAFWCLVLLFGRNGSWAMMYYVEIVTDVTIGRWRQN